MKPAISCLWLALLASVVALLGGSSRPDAVQIAILRPLVALFLVPALYYVRWEQLRQAKLLLLLFCLTALWMALQLIPLPPSLWRGLQGRDAVADLDMLIGLEGVWRPISWVPSRGWNALASLSVPVTALLLALSMRVRPRTLLLCIAGLGVFDAFWGLLQVISGASESLYFYAITNRGSPVGIFANENHSAVFSAISLLVISYLGSTSAPTHEAGWLRFTLVPAYIIVLLALLISGSRAGLAAGALALTATVAMLWSTVEDQSVRKGRGRLWSPRRHENRSRLLLLGSVLAVGGVIAVFVFLNRAEGLESVVSQDTLGDLRWKLWPVLLDMWRDHWLLGIGFGSFEAVYHIYEPTALLLPKYVNQAHNDWLQLAIEGGLPGLVLLTTLFGWIALSLRRLSVSGGRAFTGVIFWGTAIAMLCGASIVDYPLREPAMQLLVTWLLLALALEQQKGNHGDERIGAVI